MKSSSTVPMGVVAPRGFTRTDAPPAIVPTFCMKIVRAAVPRARKTRPTSPSSRSSFA